MSRLLAGDSDITVHGLVMIDAPNYSITKGQEGIPTKDLPGLVSSPSPRVQANIRASMERAQQLILTWEPPTWDAGSPPPTVLLRATDNVPVPTESNLRANVDLLRSDPKLGWGNYPALNVISVLDVHAAHHFNMFTLSRVRMMFSERLTLKILIKNRKTTR
jgi:hypothetical protein